ncbi:hypothetical protein RB195_015322 [Necator americanus]|uniref:Transmembrane protein n=1 Tax=Necator americanus TaxID=51031 RepID=A0ABR1E5U1_NECAM
MSNRSTRFVQTCMIEERSKTTAYSSFEKNVVDKREMHLISPLFLFCAIFFSTFFFMAFTWNGCNTTANHTITGASF